MASDVAQRVLCLHQHDGSAFFGGKMVIVNIAIAYQVNQVLHLVIETAKSAFFMACSRFKLDIQ